MYKHREITGSASHDRSASVWPTVISCLRPTFSPPPPPLFFFHGDCGVTLECCRSRSRCWLRSFRHFNILTSTSSYRSSRGFSLTPSPVPGHSSSSSSSSCVLSLQPPEKYLLPEVNINDYGKKCVVIDLDETLVHSSFKVGSSASSGSARAVSGNTQANEM